MGREIPTIDESLRTWLERQPLFFVATAPDDNDGLVNLSPKGGPGTLRVLGERSVAYLDMTGSGIETVAHLRQNQRISLMFCAFDGPPKVIRIYGTGRVIEPDSPDWATYRSAFDPAPEIDMLVRAIIVVEAALIRDSCGFVVPEMSLVRHRNHLYKWADHQAKSGGEGWADRYRWSNNRTSLDGLPALTVDDQHADLAGAASSEGKAL